MTIPTPSAWRYTHQDETMRIIGYSYEDVKPKNCNHPNYVGMFTAGQLNEYGQTCFDEGVRSTHTLRAAYELTVENLTAERDALTHPAPPTQQVAVPDGEGWYGHKFKEGTRGIWRCDCGKQLTDGENKCTNGTQNTLQSQPLTADAEDTQTHADTYPEREAHALSIPEVVSHEALEADAERYQLLSNYLISDDCQHDDAIVAARTVDQLNAVIAAMKEPK